MVVQEQNHSGDTISSGELHISYDDLGRGEPALLFLPGWCGSRRVFEPLLERCAVDRRVLSMDWRGHGRSASSLQDFDTDSLVEDALAVIAASGVEQVIPVALSHAGWVAIALRKQLGPRVPKLVLLDWIVLDPPPPFLDALVGLQTPGQSEAVWDALRTSWVDGIDNTELRRYVGDDMGAYGFDMRARAGREISAAYARAGNPLQSLAALQSTVQTLHLYSQPADPGYLQAQQSFAADHPWFHVQRLNASSHFPMFEVPDELAGAIGGFVESPAPGAPRSPEEVHLRWAEAMNAHNLEAAVALYEPNATLVPTPGQQVTGRAAIREILSGFLSATPRFDMEVRVAAETDTVALLASRWTMNGVAADGSQLQLSGTTADVVRRQPDGSWLAAIDCPNGA